MNKSDRPKLKKTTVQFVVIILLSVLSGLSIYAYTSGIESRIRSDQETTSVLIAVRQIEIGTTLGSANSQGYIEEKMFPRGSAPTLAIPAVNASNTDLLALQTLQPGQILLQTNFGVSAANTGALIIPDGELAVTVSMSDPARVASFLQPGSEIAIFVTGQGGNTKFTQVLISRTQVLAVGSQTLPSAGGASSGNTSSLITVAVTPSEAKRLVHASQTLSLYFGLRTAGVDFGLNTPVTDQSLLN
jgi:pilus assembly protein CpaB